MTIITKLSMNKIPGGILKIAVENKLPCSKLQGIPKQNNFHLILTEVINLRKFVIMTLCTIFLSVLSVPRVAWGYSSISQVQDVLSRIDRDTREFYDAKDSIINSMPSSQAEYQPGEIDKVLADARKTLDAEQALVRLTMDYMGKIRAALTALPELAPYLERFDPLSRSLNDVAQSMLSNEQQQFAMLEQMQQAYHNNDAASWNSLNQQYASLQAESHDLAAQLKTVFTNIENLRNEVTTSLQSELTTLQQAPQPQQTPKPQQTPAAGTKSQKLTAAAKDLLKAPVSPRYKSETIKIKGKTKLITKCNIFVYDFVKKLGYNLTELGGKEPFRAVKQIGNLAKSADANVNGWSRIKFTGNDASKEGAFRKAMEAANQGKLVIVGWVNPGGDSHVAVVVPSKDLTKEKSGKWNMHVPYIAQAGKTVSPFTSLNWGFDAKNSKDTLQIFVHD
ncbi:MAG: hypothetical protein M1536_07530 [Firmicutes bacterium]|nr:hypothetical protein [Bacillota bacterium]